MCSVKMTKRIVSCAYVYITLPILIFCIGWLKWYWAAVCVVPITISLFKLIKSGCINCELQISKQGLIKLFLAFMFIAFWVFISGIGGMSYQTSDHEARTAIFRALVEYDWPVRANTSNRSLIYYIGYWLPAAVVGKIFGYQIGYWFQAVWAVIGIFFVYYMLCIWRKKILLWPLFVLFFFSGLDYVGALLLNRGWTSLLDPVHLEWWAIDFQYSSITTQLFWVFNQGVPAWVVTLLILLQEKKSNVLFIVSTLMLSSTFPFVGLLPFVVYVILKNVSFRQKQWKNEIINLSKNVLSFQNIVGVVVIGIVCLIYLVANVSAGNISGDTMTGGTEEFYDFSATLLKYILFCAVEFGVYALLIARKHRNGFFYISLGTLFICPLIKVGGAHDFCMRASIPALFVLMLLVMDSLEEYYNNKQRKNLLTLSVLLGIGAITPSNEIHRSFINTISSAEKKESSQYAEYSIEDQVLEYDNFSGMLLEGIFKESKSVDVDNYSLLIKTGEDTMIGSLNGFYSGEFRNGAPNGEGTFKVEEKLDRNSHSNGKIVSYEGEFVNGYFDGVGKLTYEDGTVLSGNFSEGVPVGSVILTNSDGAYVRFRCIKGKPYGVCKYYDKDVAYEAYGEYKAYDWFYGGVLIRDLKKKAKEYNYSDYYGKQTKLEDKVIKLNGTVRSVTEYEADCEVRIEDRDGNNYIIKYNNGTWKVTDFHIVPNLEVGDKVFVWGYLDEVAEYTSINDGAFYSYVMPFIEPFCVEISGEKLNRTAFSFDYDDVWKNPYFVGGMDTEISGIVRNIIYNEDKNLFYLKVYGNIVNGEEKGEYYVSISDSNKHALPAPGDKIVVRGKFNGNYKEQELDIQASHIAESDVQEKTEKKVDYNLYPLIKGSSFETKNE